MPIIEELVQNGYVIRPWLGVRLSTVNQRLVLTYDLAIDEGAFVHQVVPGSPADEAGLEVDDVIVSLEDKEITTAGELVQAIHSYRPAHTLHTNQSNFDAGDADYLSPYIYQRTSTVARIDGGISLNKVI
ncbi:hypothetical protein ES703_100339 [subsurface metagenome]